ncbi:hypothetical protein Patl1_34037 [Pistacia atlantica]|uniref:Uncharacterized protein n=1 Tax=Pistacia atlantica TaxID=434234 RepID=A0ACC0ZVP7_9ROSI|nr:hypothetical protein Patl1_34037 [Pistacia atlantica]
MKANILRLFSFLGLPIPNGIAFIGEIGLGGELRMVPGMEKRASTVARLGYEKCIVPKSAEKSLASIALEKMKIIGCKNLKEVFNIVFPSPSSWRPFSHFLCYWGIVNENPPRNLYIT